MDLRRISAKDTYPIRKKVLIPEGCEGEVSVEFEHDNDEDLSFHLGVFIDGKLASVTSLFFVRHPDITDEYQYQLRGMATLPEHQRQGLSSELLRMAFSIVKQNQCHVVWCHSQERSIGFYEKVGFAKIGEPFDLPPVGKHQLMMIRLED